VDAYRMVIDTIKENPILALMMGGAFLVYGLIEFGKGEVIRFFCVCAALVVSVPLLGLLMSAIEIMMAANGHMSLGY
jgi:hypothetical protein